MWIALGYTWFVHLDLCLELRLSLSLPFSSVRNQEKIRSVHLKLKHQKDLQHVSTFWMQKNQHWETSKTLHWIIVWPKTLKRTSTKKFSKRSSIHEKNYNFIWDFSLDTFYSTWSRVDWSLILIVFVVKNNWEKVFFIARTNHTSLIHLSKLNIDILI